MKGPPGFALYAATLVAGTLALLAASKPSMLWSGIAFVALVIVGFAWVARWLDSRGAPPAPRRGDTLRWLAVPAVLGAFLLVAVTDLPMRARFELSRAEMDQAADQADEAGQVGPRRIGLFEAQYVESRFEGVRVEVGGFFWDFFGFERFSDRDITEAQVEALCDCDPSPMGGGWWTYTEDF